MLLKQIQDVLHTRIPITRIMGVRVEDYDGERIIVTAPLSENVNHMGTAFGGSLNTLAVLSGYALLWLELQNDECHIVLRESSISYQHPVRGELRAICSRPETKALEEFKQAFEQRGKARISLSAIIEENGIPAVRFEGSFVAVAPTRR